MLRSGHEKLTTDLVGSQTVRELKIDDTATPIDRVFQAFGDVYGRIIHQTTDFKRDLVVGSIQDAATPPKNSKLTADQLQFNQQVIADTAISLLARWTNSFIESLNEYTKLKKGQGASKEGNPDDSGNPFARIAQVSLEDFKAVSDFLQYADTFSLQDAAQAAQFDTGAPTVSNGAGDSTGSTGAGDSTGSTGIVGDPTVSNS